MSDQALLCHTTAISIYPSLSLSPRPSLSLSLSLSSLFSLYNHPAMTILKRSSSAGPGRTIPSGDVGPEGYSTGAR